MSDLTDKMIADIEDSNGLPVTIIASFNGTHYPLGTAFPINPLATEVVELLRHLADEIERGA